MGFENSDLLFFVLQTEIKVNPPAGISTLIIVRLRSAQSVDY